MKKSSPEYHVPQADFPLPIGTVPISSFRDHFRVADYPGVIAWWLESKCPNAATSPDNPFRQLLSHGFPYGL